MLKNPKKSLFFKKSENYERKKIFAEKKNAILLVLPIEEISFRPKLSSPARFRIQGGYPERDGGVVVVVGVVAGRHLSFLILDLSTFKYVFLLSPMVANYCNCSHDKVYTACKVRAKKPNLGWLGLAR